MSQVQPGAEDEQNKSNLEASLSEDSSAKIRELVEAAVLPVPTDMVQEGVVDASTSQLQTSSERRISQRQLQVLVSALGIQDAAVAAVDAFAAGSSSSSGLEDGGICSALDS